MVTRATHVDVELDTRTYEKEGFVEFIPQTPAARRWFAAHGMDDWLVAGTWYQTVLNNMLDDGLEVW